MVLVLTANSFCYFSLKFGPMISKKQFNKEIDIIIANAIREDVG